MSSETPRTLGVGKYESVVCRDNDLLFISNSIAKHATEVCKVLRLSDEVIDYVEKQDWEEYKKIYYAFLMWSEENTKGTWGELAKVLSDDEEMFHVVIDYLAQSPPRIEDEHELNVFVAVQASDGGQKGPAQIVLGPRNGVIDDPHGKIRENLEQLQLDFNDLMVESERALESQSIKEVRIRLAGFCVDKANSTDLFDHHMLELITKMNVPDIFVLMIRNKVWSPINYRILLLLLKQCVPSNNEVHDRFEQYSVVLRKFQRTTLLRDYMAIKGPGSKFIPHGSITITVKFMKRYKTYTMEEFAEDQAFLAGEFLLHQSILNFKESQRGCVSVTWFFPKHALQFLEPPMVNLKREALSNRKIVEIMVDEKHIYRFPSLELYRLPSPTLHHTETPDYNAMYDESITNSDEYWGCQALKFLDWIKEFDEVNGCQKEKGVFKWFSGGHLNVSLNCLDRHAAKYGDRTAVIWERNRMEDQAHGTHEYISYSQLLEMTCRMGNVLREKCSIKKGDTVVIYMPTCPLTVAAMLACARVGAVHCVLYSVLGVNDLETRLKTSQAKVVITAPKAVVGDKSFELKKNIDKVLTILEARKENTVKKVLVAMIGADNCISNQDIDLEMEMKNVSPECHAEVLESEDPLFIMYTSGTTGKPAGIVHTQAGYLLYAAMTHKHVFDYKEEEVFACVSVLGWITGHTYVVYGPLCNGATTVLFEGTATYPDPGRYWEMVERLKVNHFYTSPAAIRKMMKADSNCVGEYDVSSLRTIASVGEPLPTAAWKWYYNNVGKGKCILIDTYWQTELGGIILSPQPGPPDGMLKPGACARPFFGVEPLITNDEGTILKEKGVQGLLCLKNPIPGMGRRILGETSDSEQRSKQQNFSKYFSAFPGLYFTGDWAYRDIDGDYQIVGRKDDIVRIKGVWIQVPEIESSIARNSEKIETASYIRLSDDKHQTTDETCVVIELRETKPQTPGRSRAFYKEIIDCVKTSIIRTAGISALPLFVLLVRQNIQTWSEKLCRSIWRKHAHTYLKEVPEYNRDKMTLFDITHCTGLPCVADSEWEHLSVNTITLCV